MDRVWWVKLCMVLGFVALATYFLYPSYEYYFNADAEAKSSRNKFCDSLPSWTSCSKFNLGLDLQGGVHLVMGVVVEKAVQDRVDRMASAMEDLLKDEKIEYEKVFVPEPENAYTADGDVSLELVASTEIQVYLKNAGDLEKFKKSVRKRFGNVLDTIVEKDEGKTIFFALSEEDADYVRTEAVEQAIKAIRNRADKLGVAEPTIAKRGTDNILIQLPGVKDPQRAIDIIGRTAQLEFKIVDDVGSSFIEEIIIPAESKVKKDYYTYQGPKGQVREVYLTGTSKEEMLTLLKDSIPPNREIAFEEIRNKKTGNLLHYRSYLLHRRAGITGDYLTSASVQMDRETQRYYVAMDFDIQGGKIFEELTGSHIRERMAVVLDGVVNSAPVIEGRIGGGSARITLGGYGGQSNLQEAKDLTLVLKAGALPAPVIIREKRQVGESLGRDSIEKGSMAIMVGFILVILFMVIYYKFSGVIADLALLLNVLFILAIMAMFEATLTLPGMAGIVLVIGMAVDANVIIFERIREELDIGKTPRAAVESGYGKAFWTIFDANVTTIIAGIVLMQYGSGPVRGFAVTLIVGIISSMFTAIVVTRLIYDAIIAKKTRTQSLSI